MVFFPMDIKRCSFDVRKKIVQQTIINIFGSKWAPEKGQLNTEIRYFKRVVLVLRAKPKKMNVKNKNDDRYVSKS